MAEIHRKLMEGSLSVLEAGKLAREATEGKPVSFGRAVRPMHEVEAGLAFLAGEIQGAPASSPRKWAAMFLLTSALLGAGLVAKVLERIREVTHASGGSCPEEARPFAVGMIDTVLEDGGDAVSGHEFWLREARSRFEGSP